MSIPEGWFMSPDGDGDLTLWADNPKHPEWPMRLVTFYYGAFGDPRVDMADHPDLVTWLRDVALADVPRKD